MDIYIYEWIYTCFIFHHIYIYIYPIHPSILSVGSMPSGSLQGSPCGSGTWRGAGKRRENDKHGEARRMMYTMYMTPHMESCTVYYNYNTYYRYR